MTKRSPGTHHVVPSSNGGWDIRRGGAWKAFPQSIGRDCRASSSPRFAYRSVSLRQGSCGLVACGGVGLHLLHDHLRLLRRQLIDPLLQHRLLFL